MGRPTGNGRLLLFIVKGIHCLAVCPSLADGEIIFFKLKSIDRPLQFLPFGKNWQNPNRMHPTKMPLPRVSRQFRTCETGSGRQSPSSLKASVLPSARYILLASLRRAVKIALERRNCQTALTRLPWQACLKLSDIANWTRTTELLHHLHARSSVHPLHTSSQFAYANWSGLYYTPASVRDNYHRPPYT